LIADTVDIARIVPFASIACKKIFNTKKGFVFRIATPL